MSAVYLAGMFQGWRARSADEAYGELRDQVVLGKLIENENMDSTNI